MDVDYAHFWAQLVPILRSISQATFITIDVEMGGISARRPGGNDRSHTPGKPTLQQQYEETKEAAETYQILQLGITCVKEDFDREMYVAQPYNFNVSPLFLQGGKLEIHRDITLSSSAVHFLMKNSFDMGAVFTKGVPYLSREEEASASQNYTKRQETQSTIPDITIPPNDVEAHKFYDKAKKTISDWFGKEQPATDFVNIGCYGGLNGFQRRLVHQLVRNEFQGYRTFARNGGEFMQVEKTDPGKEAQIAKIKLQSFESGLGKQTGLRFLIEALVGGDLTGLDPKWFCVNESGDPAFANVESIKQELQELKENLKKKSQVLVGHNLFTDLIFIYKTFIGSLPDTVTEFNSRIHALFPQVIDTKYLATHKGGSMQTKSTLKDLCADLKDRTVPLIVLAENHTGYGPKGKEHEAGFDSWMTAQVLVKLSSKLAAERNGSVDASVNVDMALKTKVSVDMLDNGGVILNPPDTNGLSQVINMRLGELDMKNVGGNSGSHKLNPRQKLGHRVDNQSSSGTILDMPLVEGTDDESTVHSSSGGTDGGVSLKSPLEPRDSSLMDSDIDDGFKLVSKKKPHLRAQVPSKSIFGPGDLNFAPDGTSRQWHASQLNKYAVLDPEKQNLGPVEPTLSKWMPDLKGPFWKPYTNRLRVYGTEDEICHLGK